MYKKVSWQIRKHTHTTWTFITNSTTNIFLDDEKSGNSTTEKRGWFDN